MAINKEFRKLFALVLMLIFSFVLLAFRYYLFGSEPYLFLLWNVFLAWIPYGISCIMLLISNYTKTKWWLFALIPLGIVWLIFFPNAPYMLTDYAHFSWVGFFKGSGSAFTLQPWYDFILFSSFILCGVLAGLASLRIIHQLARKYFGWIIAWIILVVINFLSSWAIYLGRFIRLNSWDAYKTPEILMPYIQLGKDKAFFVIALGIFLLLIYFVIYSFGDGKKENSNV